MRRTRSAAARDSRARPPRAIVDVADSHVPVLVDHLAHVMKRT
ncbi:MULTISPECIES: hypothetical protein [unclassified Streptomyces]|nr:MULTISPECIES: hypothetical protein [unclassified Streptomyces]